MPNPHDDYIPLSDEDIEIIASMNGHDLGGAVVRNFIRVIPDLLLKSADMAREIRSLRAQLGITEPE